MPSQDVDLPRLELQGTFQLHFTVLISILLSPTTMTTRVFTRRPQHDIVTSTQHLLGDASPGSPQPSRASICELVGSYDIHLDV